MRDERATSNAPVYRHWSGRIFYTHGVREQEERCEACWLTDFICAHLLSPEMQEAAKADPRVLHMHLWALTADGTSATLTARPDDIDDPFITQEIWYTDFPQPRADIWASRDSGHWLLFLPSEY